MGKKESGSKEKGKQLSKGEGEKKVPGRDEETKINRMPPDEARAKFLKENKVRTEGLDLDLRQEFSLFGDAIPTIGKDFALDVMESKLKIVLKKGKIVKSETNSFYNRSYKILKKLEGGSSIYLVSDAAHDDHIYFLKAEIAEPIKGDSNMAYEVMLLQNSCQTEEMFREHFLKLVDYGRAHKGYNIMVLRLGGQNLVDLRKKLEPNHEFSRVDATRLCMQTLQAVHDVHLCCFIHRDIQPRNFVVGATDADQNVVYMVNFGFSFKYFPKKKRNSLLMKHSSLSRKFQPRVFHTGSEYKRMGDMESWLYLCFWFFDSKCLPWMNLSDGKERIICNKKELFFNRFYDKRMSGAFGTRLPKFLWFLRDKIHTDSLAANFSPINYPFFAEAIQSAESEFPIDWKQPYQWQRKPKSKNPLTKSKDIFSVSKDLAESRTASGSATKEASKADPSKDDDDRSAK